MPRLLLACLIVCLPLGCMTDVRPLVVVGGSMAPTLRNGQVALLRGSCYAQHPLQVGDVIAFRFQGRLYVKRIHALAGDRVELLRADGDLSIIAPGEATLAAKIAAHRPEVYQVCRVTVPPGHVYVLGDCLPASIDSRELGSIPISAILGRVQTLSGSLLFLDGLGPVTRP